MPATSGRSAVAKAAAVVTALVALGLLAAPVPASAHGSLVVPTARLQAQGDTVEVAWSAAEDDTAAIAVALGMAPMDALLDHLAALAALDGDADPQPLVDDLLANVDRDRLAGSPELHGYLLDTIVVHQDQRPCTGTVGATDAFLTEGVTLTFRCPEPIDTIDLTVTVLMDQDPTHRTFSTDGRGDVALHTRAAPTQAWQLDATTATAPATVGIPGDGLAAIAVGLAASLAAMIGVLALLGRGTAP